MTSLGATHQAHESTSQAPCTELPPIDPNIAREAAHWLAQLHSGDAGPADWQAFERWKVAAPAHAIAWQRAERVGQTLGLVPAYIGAQPLLASAQTDAARRATRRALTRTLATLIVAGPLSVAGYRQLPWRAWMASVQTATGEVRTLQLPDGSQLTLDTASAIDIDFNDQWRRIDLQAGALLVQTAADIAHRPFVVHNAQGRLRALGTRFVVRQHEDASLVQVLDGAVELQPIAAQTTALVLNAGFQATLRRHGVSAPEPCEPYAGAWASGVLYAHRMPLGVFLTELSRYRPGLLQCDPAIAGLPVSGAFQLRNTDAVLAMLQETLPVATRMRTRYWVTLVPA